MVLAGPIRSLRAVLVGFPKIKVYVNIALRRLHQKTRWWEQGSSFKQIKNNV